MKKNILSLFRDKNDLDRESAERVRNLLREFDYATKYLSINLKVRPFVVSRDNKR